MFVTSVGAQIKSSLPNWRSICWENHLLMRRAANPQGEQTVRLSPVVRLPASSAPPTVHAMFLSSFSVIGEHPPQESSTKTGLQCSQTQLNVIAPLPSVSPTSCLRKSVLLHIMLFMKALRTSSSSGTCHSRTGSLSSQRPATTSTSAWHPAILQCVSVRFRLPKGCEGLIHARDQVLLLLEQAQHLNKHHLHRPSYHPCILRVELQQHRAAAKDQVGIAKSRWDATNWFAVAKNVGCRLWEWSKAIGAVSV